MSEDSEAGSPAEILIVDDDDLVRATLARILERSGHSVRYASTAADARAAVEQALPNVILCDVMMPGESGLELLDSLGKDFEPVPVVMVSGLAQLDVARSALQKGAYGWVTKPFDASQVLIAVDNALIRARLEFENSGYRDRLKAMVKQRTQELAETVTKLEQSEAELRRVTEDTIREVVDIARGVLSDLDTETVLHRVLDAARTLSGARYAALGVLDDSRERLARFVTSGLDDDARFAIGAPPTGHGVLGELIRNPVPLRLERVGQHPRSYGFPPAHPPMSTFLGVPVVVGGKPFGNLYLTEKHDGEPFTAEDQRAVALLAELAGVAIDHAHRFGHSEARRQQLERTVDALQATVQIARTLGGRSDPQAVLEIIAKRARALVSARSVLVMMRDGDELVVAAAAGDAPAAMVGHRTPIEGSLVQAALRSGRSLRPNPATIETRLRDSGMGPMGDGVTAAIIVPLLHGRNEGAVAARDRTVDGPGFSDYDEMLLEAFVDSAAAGLAAAHAAHAERETQRRTIAELEAELANLRAVGKDPARRASLPG